MSDFPRVDENGCYTLPNGDCVGCPHCPHSEKSYVALDRQNDKLVEENARLRKELDTLMMQAQGEADWRYSLTAQLATLREEVAEQKRVRASLSEQIKENCRDIVSRERQLVTLRELLEYALEATSRAPAKWLIPSGEIAHDWYTWCGKARAALAATAPKEGAAPLEIHDTIEVRTHQDGIEIHENTVGPWPHQDGLSAKHQGNKEGGEPTPEKLS